MVATYVTRSVFEYQSAKLLVDAFFSSLHGVVFQNLLSLKRRQPFFTPTLNVAREYIKCTEKVLNPRREVENHNHCDKSRQGDFYAPKSMSDTTSSL